MNIILQNSIVIFLAIFLSLIHLSVVYLSKIKEKKQKILTSIGGGISVAYVFLHLMPELASSPKGNIGNISIDADLLEISFFFASLLGLIILFVVDAWAAAAKIPREINFKIHLLYNISISFLYSFTLPEVVKEGLFYSLLYTMTLAAHVLSSDRVIFRFHEKFYRSKFRWIGFSTVLIGVIISLTFKPNSSLEIDYAFAFLSGGVLLNTFLEELPKKTILNVKWFLTSILLTSASIFLALIIKHRF